MQSDHQYSPQKLVAPPADQVAVAYMQNDPITSVFGGTRLLSSVMPSHPFHGVELQPSAVCSKNFIIFDQTDNRSRIMFHPGIAPKLCCTGLTNDTLHFQADVEKRNASIEREEISSPPHEEDSDDIDALLSLEEEEQEEYDEEEVSTARTYGSCGSDSPDSCSNYGSKPSKKRLPSAIQMSLGSGRSCSERKRLKMRKMVKALKTIVPGANRMNSVAVLDEAVRYLKSLKVEVQKIGVGNLKSYD